MNVNLLIFFFLDTYQPKRPKDSPSFISLVGQFALERLYSLVGLVEVTLDLAFESLNSGCFLFSLVSLALRRSQSRVQFFKLNKTIRAEQVYY
jgi:hypothetical protein